MTILLFQKAMIIRLYKKTKMINIKRFHPLKIRINLILDYPKISKVKTKEKIKMI